MALPNISLERPYLIIRQSASLNGLIATNGTFNTATVQNVYDTSDRFEEGDAVGYWVEHGVTFTYSGNEYIMIDEQFCFFTETAAP